MIIIKGTFLYRGIQLNYSVGHCYSAQGLDISGDGEGLTDIGKENTALCKITSNIYYL